MDPAGEKEIFRSKASLLDPGLDGIARWRCDLELHRSLRLLLHDDRSGCDLLAMADIANLEFHEVTASQFAVNAEVEQRKLSDAALHLKANS